MADIVRLAIVYDTANAASNLRALDTGLGRVQGSSKGASLAAVRLAESLQSGNVSAVSLTRSLETLLGPAFGSLAIGLGLGVGAFKLWSDHANKTAELTKTLTKEVDTARDAVRKLLGVQTNETAKQITELTKRIHELQDELNKPTALDRLGKFLGGVGRLLGLAMTGGTALGIAETGAAASDQRIATAVAIEQLKVLKSQLVESQRLTKTFGALSNVGIGAGGKGNLTAGQQAALAATPLGQSIMMGSNVNLQGPSPFTLDQQARAIEEAERHARTMADALWSLSDALENFVLKGTFAFRQLLDNILSSFFREAAGKLIGDLVHGAFPTLPKFQEGGIVSGVGPQLAVVHGGEEIIPAGRGPSVATSVTFNVQAQDSQDVARFFERHGGLLAATIAREADRSRGLRRRLAR